jgi:hypothetical protein
MQDMQCVGQQRIAPPNLRTKTRLVQGYEVQMQISCTVVVLRYVMIS